MHFSRQLNCWSLRCSWSIACRCYSNYIFILHLTLGFNILRKDNCRPRRETFKFWDLVCLVLESLQYISKMNVLIYFSSCDLYKRKTVCEPYWFFNILFFQTFKKAEIIFSLSWMSCWHFAESEPPIDSVYHIWAGWNPFNRYSLK